MNPDDHSAGHQKVPAAPSGTPRGSSRRSKTWRCIRLAAADYATVLDVQRNLVEIRHADRQAPDIVLLLEHLPVFTLGRRGGRENLTVPEQRLTDAGISLVQVERGGNITYHGPGQLVGYPIIDLKTARMDVHTYVSRLEDIMILTARDYGVDAGRNPKNRGVWVGNNKMGSIGISIRHGIAFHGFALNVNLALEPFNWVNPCGLTGIGMTSIEKELGRTVSMEKAYQSIRRHMATVFDVSVVPWPATSRIPGNLDKTGLAILTK